MKPTKILICILLVVVSFAAGYFFSRTGSSDKGPSAQEAVHYTCPMHPQYISDHPGDCPSCGMRLVPAEREGSSNGKMEMAERAMTVPGTVQISTERQQMMGVRLAGVSRAAGTRHLRTLGRVAADETRIYIVNATIEGWITSTEPIASGDYVKKDQVLARFYSPEFLSATQAMLFALNSMDRVQVTGKENQAQKDQIAQFTVNLQQYKDSLRNLGMGANQINELIKTRKRTENVDITAPAAGYILTRKVSDGLRFNQGDELYRIADFSRVWILADVFEREEKFLRPGTRTKAVLPNQGIEFEAKVSDALPLFDPVARTLKVRLLADNPKFKLRPDMFVDLDIPVNYPPAVTIPVDAIIDSGLKKTVFVEIGGGIFEPREVETGWRSGGRVEIVSGLTEGESIVVSGTFLVDSESKMNASIAGFSNSGVPASSKNAVKDVVCGMDVDVNEAKASGRMSSFKGVAYYFCSDFCKRSFDKDPGSYLKDAQNRKMP